MAKQKIPPITEHARQIVHASKTLCENLLKALSEGKSVEAIRNNQQLLEQLAKDCSKYLYRTRKNEVIFDWDPALGVDK